jgi:tetratricopeptide (TPR) repeat protein
VTSAGPVAAFATPPDPSEAKTLDAVAHQLRLLKIWAGDPSYEVIKDRINAVRTGSGVPAGELARKNTVADCFKAGRRRLNTELVIAVVEALHPDAGYVAQWRQCLRIVVAETEAAVQVRAQDVLPDDIGGFTGRAAEIEKLLSGTAPVCAVEGMAGVGKTQFVIHAAHLLTRGRAFDQILFVNLRGFHPDPAQPPADPGAALDSFLRLLGVPGQRIPHPLAARAAAYRECLANRRVLVVLDNAANEEQVAPLLPEVPGSLTLITSRRRLTGLRVATHLSLGVFTPDEAADFLAAVAPDVPPGEDADALKRVAQRSGHLPLALGVIGAHLRAKPGWTYTDHADWLDQRHEARRLDTAVELALSLSYNDLPPERQQLFRLLALHPGQDLDPIAVAALAGTTVAAADDQLHRLVDDHLLQQPQPGRFVFHDLVRAYAADRSSDEDRPKARRDALTRLLDHYLSGAAAAMDTLFPAEKHRRPRVPPTTVPLPAVGDATAARGWIDAERVNLVAATIHAATHGWPQHATGLAATIFRILDMGGFHREAKTVHGHAHRAARRSGDRPAEVHALTDLGNTSWQLGDYEQAVDFLDEAVALSRAAKFREGEGRALANLGLVHRRLGHFPEAIEYYEQARVVFREIGDRVGEAHAFTFLGVVHELTGRFEEAAAHHGQALILCRELGDRTGEAYALGNLGIVHQRMGQYGRAVDHLNQTLALCLQLGNRFGEGHALTDLGVVYGQLGRHAEAVDHHRRALAVFQDCGDRGGESEARNGLGKALRDNGEPAEALAEYRTALALATEIGDRYEEARAHDGIAFLYRDAGDPRARHHWEEALSRYADLGVPEADQVRANLTEPRAVGGRPG